MSLASKLQSIDELKRLTLKVPPPYFSQSIQLVQLCSRCLPVGPVTEQQWNKLLQAVQEAIEASASPGMNQSDRLFSDATDSLVQYYSNLRHPDSGNVISGLMEAAKEKDALVQKELLCKKARDDRLQRKINVRVRGVVDLSLALSRRKSPLVEILWMLIKPKDGVVHLTLRQNPYFYRGELATLEAQKPISFYTELTDLEEDQLNVLVLVDREHRIFVETREGRKVYGNIWRTSNGIILKGVKGKLLTAAEVMDENQPLAVSFGTHVTTAKTWKEFVAAAVTNDTAEWRIKVILPTSYLVVSFRSRGSGVRVINVCTWEQFVLDAAGSDDTEWHAWPLNPTLELSGPEIRQLCEQYDCMPIDALDQAIGSQSTSSEKSREYLRALTKICGLTGELPSSHILTEGLSRLDDNPVAGGSFGDVWRGTYNNRLVAIKSLRIPRADQLEAVRKDFCKEVVLWKRLSHPNIVPLYGVSTELFPLCMVSEWMTQGHIRDYVRVNPGVSRLPLLLDVANGLSHLHSANLVHGDLKGDNILINDAGTARLCDFGLSSVTRTLAAQTTTRGGCGTIGWMAPELFGVENTDDVTTLSTRASDIYALSIVIIEIITGERPFNNSTYVRVIFNTIQGFRPDKPANTSELGISDELWEVVTMCWRPEPQDRPDISFVLESFRNPTRRRIV